jgi:hypothetical protein
VLRLREEEAMTDQPECVAVRLAATNQIIKRNGDKPVTIRKKIEAW